MSEEALRQDIARVLIDYGNGRALQSAIDGVFAIPDIKEALADLAAKRQIEAHFAATRDERKFVG